MYFSKQLAGACLCVLCIWTPYAKADEVKLDNNRVCLSGEILSIQQEGIIELASPLSKKPLKLKSGTLNEAVFSTQKSTDNPPPIMLRLSNGDTLPVHQLIDMKDGQLQTKSDITGMVSIVRHALDSAQFGITANQGTYANTLKLDEWLDEENEHRNWEYKARALVANGSARASHQFDLPRNFVISFKLAWNDKNPPSFRMLFAHDPKLSETGNDFYRLNFSNSGVHLERESSRSKRQHTLAQLRRLPSQYTQNEVTFEIRVHRESRRIELLINGEPESSCIDPIDEIPQGSTITIECNSASGSIQRISEFSIIEFTNTHARHLSEGRGESHADTLITADDDRLTGRLLAITPSPEGNLLRFQSDFMDHPLEIPQSEVATILFAKPAPEATKEAQPSPFQIKLHDQGLLHIHQLELTNGRISALHPLLGRLNINKPSVQAILRTEQK